MKRLCLLALLLLGVIAVMPSAAKADGPPGAVNAQAESYAMRIEYDIPLPVGTGTVGHVNGEARRSNAGENVHGIAAAPSELDAVIGGRYIDPQQTGHPVNRPPQSECFYPGALLSTHFNFPTETQDATKPAPATSYSTARCSAGPELELHAVDGQPPVNGVLDVGAVAADALARPDKDLLTSTTEARASGISVLGGVVKIGSVKAFGHSQTTGQPGGGASRAEVVVSDIAVAGQTFSLATGTVDGKEVTTLTAGGQTVPVASPQGQAFMDTVNASLKPQGCTMTAATSPATYPQGYVFSRPEPEVGVKPDGTLAASYRGGMLLVCTLPRAVSDPTTFSPQRMQMLFGFAFTSTSASGELGGFNFGDLVGGVDTGPVLGGTFDEPVVGSVSVPIVDTLPSVPSITPPASTTQAVAAPETVRTRPALAIPRLKMDQGLRLFIGVVCLVLWGFLTHLASRRYLKFVTDGEEAV